MDRLAARVADHGLDHEREQARLVRGELEVERDADPALIDAHLVWVGAEIDAGLPEDVVLASIRKHDLPPLHLGTVELAAAFPPQSPHLEDVGEVDGEYHFD